MTDEYPHTCGRCRGGVLTPGLCRECQYIRKTFGSDLDRKPRPQRGARGLEALREELGVGHV